MLYPGLSGTARSVQDMHLPAHVLDGILPRGTSLVALLRTQTVMTRWCTVVYPGVVYRVVPGPGCQTTLPYTTLSVTTLPVTSPALSCPSPARPETLFRSRKS